MRVATVAMKGCSPSRAMSTPLTRPTAAPAASAAAIASLASVVAMRNETSGRGKQGQGAVAVQLAFTVSAPAGPIFPAIFFARDSGRESSN
jgi:hypothetical protein